MEILEAIGLFVCILALFALVIFLFTFIWDGKLKEDELFSASITLLVFVAFLFSVICVKFVNHPEEFGYTKIVEETTASQLPIP